MKLLTAKEIKKIVIGVIISDGHVDLKNQRFDFYSKEKEYAEYVAQVLNQITGMHVHFQIKNDKRGYVGYRVFTRKHAYWKNIGEKFYCDKGRKELSAYITSRIDEEALAHLWMCDGYLEHAKNRKLDKVQNIGWFCLESFPKEELDLLRNKMMISWGIESSLIKKPWGFGYRIRIGGESLQKFISLVYPYILDCFRYKTPLFYKTLESANMNLSSAKHFIMLYDGVDDIVRHSKQLEKT